MVIQNIEIQYPNNMLKLSHYIGHYTYRRFSLKSVVEPKDQHHLKWELFLFSLLYLLIWTIFWFTQTQTYEIILTLGQAFEVAYQMAVQSRARHYVPPSSLGSEFIETKISRPVSQSWSSMRRSAVSTTLRTLKWQWACVSVGLWAFARLVKRTEGEKERDAVQSEFRKGAQTSWPTFSPPLNPQWEPTRGQVLCMIESDESSRPPPNSESLQSWENFFLCTHETWWIDIFAALRQVIRFPPQTFQPGPAGWSHPLPPHYWFSVLHKC